MINHTETIDFLGVNTFGPTVYKRMESEPRWKMYLSLYLVPVWNQLKGDKSWGAGF